MAWIGKSTRTEFDGSVEAEEDVVRLDVAVDDVVVVEELERLEHLAAHGRDLTLVHARLRHHVRQRAAREVLHYHLDIP